MTSANARSSLSNWVLDFVHPGLFGAELADVVWNQMHVRSSYQIAHEITENSQQKSACPVIMSDVLEKLRNDSGAPGHTHFDHDESKEGLHCIRGDIHALSQLFVSKSHRDAP